MQIDNPAFNYDQYGQPYSSQRSAEPAIAAFIDKALGDAATVLNVGAGAGSYEPEQRYVIAVEPSSEMRAQRLAKQRTPAIIAKADALPFDDNSFDAVMTLLSVHHWPDMHKGLQELKRVARHRVIVMTFDPEALDLFWNAHYFPELIAVEKARYPKIDWLAKALGGHVEVVPVPVPLHCSDGFQEAFYGRPEAFLQKEVRQSQSAWGFLTPEQEAACVQRLADDLTSGEWDKRYGMHRSMPEFTGALRIVSAS